MNQNDLGKEYQVLLLKEYFSNKEFFNVPNLTKEEKDNKADIEEQLSPNVKAVIIESVEEKLKPFYEIDDSFHQMDVISTLLKDNDEKDINRISKELEPIEDKVSVNIENNKQTFNQINQEFKIATIEKEEDLYNPEKSCYVTNVQNGYIELETEDSSYIVTIPHQDYLEISEDPNKYDFKYDKDTENIYYIEQNKAIDYVSDGLENTPRFYKDKTIEKNNEIER